MSYSKPSEPVNELGFSGYNTSYRQLEFFIVKAIPESLYDYFVPNTCILELPVSATNTFPSGSIAISSGLLN